MKKLYIFLSFIFTILAFSEKGWGQTTLYTTDFGTTSAFPAGWTAGGSGTMWSCNTTSASSGYAGASGSDNAENGTSGTATLIYNNSLTTVGYTNITVMWGARMTGSGASPTFQWSIDGSTWNSPSAYTDVSATSTWALVNSGTQITLGAGAAGAANLQFKWTSNSSTNTYRIDDFSVQGTVAATPAIALADNGPQVTAASVVQGTTNVVLHQSQLTVTTANATLTGMTCTTAGTYASADITNLKVWYSNSSTFSAGGSTLLSTYTTPGVAGTKTFPSFSSQIINSGTTGYIYITADIAAGATAGNTIYISPGLATTDFTFSSGSKSGSTTAGGTQTFIVAPTPSVALADNGTQVPAASVAQGTLNVVLHQSQLTVTTANATLTGMTCTTAGTYASADVTDLKVWYSNSSTFSAGGSTLLSTYTTPGVAGTKTFPSFSSQIINSGTTVFIYITADIATGAIVGHAINVNALTTGNFTFSSGSVSGSTAIGGAQTIIAASPPVITLADNGAPDNDYQVVAGYVAKGATNIVLHQSQLGVTTGFASLTGMTCTTAGSYVTTTDVIDLKVYYSTSSTFSVGSSTLLSTYTNPGGAGGPKTFPAFTSQIIYSGTTGYIYITADIGAGATVGHTINLSALTTANFTFSSGAVSGSTTAGGVQTVETNVSISTATGGIWSAPATWAVGGVPGAGYYVTIASGAVVTLDASTTSNVTLDALIINGDLEYSNQTYYIQINGPTTVSGTGIFDDYGDYILLEGTTEVMNGGIFYNCSHGSLTNCGEIQINNGVIMTVDAGGVLTCNNTSATLAFNVFDVGMGGDATLVINGAFYINSVIAGAPAIYTYNGDANITVGTTGTIDYMQGDFTSPTNTIIKYAATGSNLVFSGTGSSTTVQGLWPAAANYPYNVTINTIGTITTDDAKTINGTLTLQAGTLARTAGNLTMGAGSNIYRSGGTISYASANITFTNYNLYYNNFAASITTGTECTTSATALKNLTIESLGGYGVTLGAATTINTSGSLTLTSGVLTTTSYLLTVSNTAAGAITGGSTTSFIDGPVKWNIGTGSYVFPVGNGSGNYLPFTLVTSASASPVITVQAFNSDAGAAATFGASLSGISHTEFWSATLNLGTFTGKVSLTRQTALQANLSLIGQSAAQAGSYASIGGTASSPSINTSNAITSVLGYFVMGFSPTTNYYWNGSNVTAFNHPWDNAGTYWTSPTAIAGLNAIWPAVTGSYTANFTSATAATTVTLPGTIAYNPVNTIIGTNNYTFTSSSPASLNSPIALGGNTLTLAPASAVNSITLPGIISGTGGITNTTGTSILSGANTYSGTTTLSSGTLDINNAAAIGTGTFTITGGTIDNTSGGTITLSNNNVQNWNGDFTFTGTNALNVGTGAVAMNASRQVTVSSSTLAVGGIISGAFRLTKAGSGALTLSGANNYTGGMTLSAGTLNINNASALGTIAGTFIINGGTIDNTTAGSITTVNYPQTWGGDFTFAGSQNLNLGTGAVSMSASRTVTISSNTLTIGGVISGATFGLTKTGAGTLTLTNTGNTYSGTTIITGGTLTLNPNAVAATFASQVELNGGTLSTTSIATNTVITSSSTLNLNASSTIALGTNVHSLKFADSHSISWTGSTTLTITGWTGTVSTGPGTGGRIFFGGATGTLTAGQLAQISFTGYTGAMLTASGELVPVSAPCTAPSTQASGFSTPIITSNSIDYAFTRGNGNDVLVICKAGSAPTAPTCGTIYSASATYGSGTAVGGGYCVYNGTAAGASNPTGNITITGLTGGTTYYFGVYEYNTTGTCYDLTALTGGPITTTTCQTMNGYPHPQMTGFVINSCKTGTGCAADESLEEGSNEMCIFNSGPTPIPVTNSATAAANIALYYGSTIGSGDWENYSSSYVSDPVGYCALLNTTAGCGKTLFIDALTAGTIPANSIFLITSQSPNYPYNFSNLCGICPYIYVLFSTSPYWTCCAHEEGGRTGNFANTASGIRYFGTSITDNTSVNTTWYYQYNPGSSGQAWSPEDTPGDEISYAIATSSNATSGNPLAPTQYFTNACTSVGSSILPIELIYFNATCSDNKVDLPWSTASETNNDYFTIERSKDGEIWETVTVVKGAGNSNSTIDYNAQDNSPSSNVSYYRLKQTDFNGKTVSFNPVAVSCNSNSTDYFVLKPNPAIDEVTCSVVSSEDNNAIIEIINYLGQKMFFNNYNLTKGFNDIKFDISKYSNGIYTVIVYSSDGKIINSKQLVIQRR